MSRNQIGKRRLCAESLESRELLAGDVTLKVIGGNLFMTGDNANNSVTIAGTATPGKFTVTGAAGTKIDGKAAETVTGISASIIANLNDGNDVLKVNNANIGGNLIVDMGTGTNTFNTTKVSVGGSLVSTSVNGSNTDNMSGLSVSHDAVFNLLGSGNESVTIGGTKSSLGGSLVIDIGAGKNTISLDKLAVSNLLKIVDGSTTDTVTIKGTTADQLLYIDAANGKDHVELGVAFNAEKNSFRIAQVFLGGGDDELDVHNTTVSLVTIFDGGPGTNKFKDNGGNSLANLQKVNFS